MTSVLNVIGTTLAVLLVVPAFVLLLECIAAVSPAPRTRGATRARPAQPDSARLATCVVIPAHDEAAGLARVVDSLLRQLRPGDRLLVVADNCTDATASVARAAGADVIERNSPSERGKGFAIAHALRHLSAVPPDVIVLVDADCEISAGGIERLAARAFEDLRPIQAEYLITAPPATSARTAISAFAVLVRNRVRPRGLRRLGLPCHLTGSGMAFPWHVISRCPVLGANLVEDLAMGIELAVLGYPAQSDPEVRVLSSLPEEYDSAMRQRRRWEHGHLDMLRHHFLRLIKESIAQRRVDLLALALDLAVPPLTLLILLEAVMLIAAAALFAATGSGVALLAASFATVCTLLALGVAWVVFGRGVLAVRHVLLAPAYLLQKMPLYVSYFLRRKQRDWERTRRSE